MKHKLYTGLESILVPISISISLKLIDEPLFFILEQQLERYVNILPIYGFSSGRYDLNFINFFSIPI